MEENLVSYQSNVSTCLSPYNVINVLYKHTFIYFTNYIVKIWLQFVIIAYHNYSRKTTLECFNSLPYNSKVYFSLYQFLEDVETRIACY